jgi:peptidoglycan/xylan/chitin deacetylase (PgdA/CDA1 family)
MPLTELVHHLATYVPRRLWLLRLTRNAANIETRGREIVVLLSSDTEFDPPTGNGNWKNRSSKCLDDGLPKFLDVCDLYGASATLFCEGKLVQDLPNLFRDLSRHHEIGCHSFAHEWLGTKPPPRWIPRRDEQMVLSTSQKTRLLTCAFESIDKTIGKKPRSFKAPFNSVDHPSTLALLNQIGFDTDSSLPSYRKGLVNPLRLVPPHHASSRSLWIEGKIPLVEVPFMVRSKPLLFHPYDEREGVVDTVSRGMRLALQAVDIQCRIDSLLGRDVSVIHITSHPWEFSEVRPWGGHGKANANRLTAYLNALSAYYEVTFLTISEFTEMWEKEYCSLHSKREGRLPARHDDV